LQTTMFKTVLAASILGATSATLSNSSPEALKEMFESFKQKFGRNYATMDEELTRFATFTENLKLVDERNAVERAAGGSAEHGITQFSDMSQQEFADMFLTLDVTKKMGNATLTEVKPYEGVETLVDWTGKYTTAVKNQGYCGSCWAFAASEQIEADAHRMLGYTGVLSPEQLVDCDTRSSGCNGGWPEYAYDYVKRTGGIETEASYPYTAYYGRSGTCQAASSKYVIKVTSYYTLGSESQMASYVKSTGTLSVCIDASTWNSYTGGIMSSCGTQVNHAVQAVGVDDSISGYWKVRNSWGSTWGESGYIRLKYGANTCRIAYDPSYTSVARV